MEVNEMFKDFTNRSLADVLKVDKINDIVNAEFNKNPSIHMSFNKINTELKNMTGKINVFTDDMTSAEKSKQSILAMNGKRLKDSNKDLMIAINDIDRFFDLESGNWQCVCNFNLIAL